MQIYANLCKAVVARAKTCKPNRRQHEWEEKAGEITGIFKMSKQRERRYEGVSGVMGGVVLDWRFSEGREF
jgi:hypothetical protein